LHNDPDSISPAEHPTTVGYKKDSNSLTLWYGQRVAEHRYEKPCGVAQRVTRDYATYIEKARAKLTRAYPEVAKSRNYCDEVIVSATSLIADCRTGRPLLADDRSISSFASINIRYA
jgi:hypothetical protein